MKTNREILKEAVESGEYVTFFVNTSIRLREKCKVVFFDVEDKENNEFQYLCADGYVYTSFENNVTFINK